MPNGESLHILLVEDNLDHAEIILRRIRRAGAHLDAEHVTTLGDGVAALSNREWDAILLDLQLPDSRDLETLDVMVGHAGWIPVIVMTSLGDEDLATAAVQQGAQDYLVKDDFTSEVLHRAIRYAIERKRIEERLKSSLTDLAGHAKELEQLNARLQEQNTDLDNFNHMISHDLREPIRHLLLFSGRLQHVCGPELPDRAKKDLQLVFAAAERMASSVAGLQTLSQAGQRNIRRSAVSLHGCLSAALEDLTQPIDERNAAITWDPLPDVEADGALVTLLFRNLISNAIKYCTDQPMIHVSVENDSKGRVLGVRDNGIGIDPLYAERIFAPFQRLHGREEYGGGAGLGLAICQKIVARHDGTIWVDSAPGAGAHFRFTLAPNSGGSSSVERRKGQQEVHTQPIGAR